MAWTSYKPQVVHLRKLIRKYPHTTILTCSRVGAHVVNELMLKARYRFQPLVTLDADVESNPDNYTHGRLKKKLSPSKLKIYRGMRVYLTRNVRKEVDFVNGMLATVLGFNRKTKELRVETSTKYTISIYPWTDTDLGNMVYYPVRGGYASTILKFQGAELSHVTLFLDKAKVFFQ